jgi:hypothetical protein
MIGSRNATAKVPSGSISANDPPVHNPVDNPVDNLPQTVNGFPPVDNPGHADNLLTGNPQFTNNFFH